MDTSGLRASVAEAIEHEKKTGTLARLVLTSFEKRYPGESGETHTERTEAVVGVIRAYVEAMPEVVDAAVNAAEQAGVRDSIEPMFVTALAYVEEDLDFIPDSLGLAGLVDDAYLVHNLMQEMSQRHRALTGKDLVPPAASSESQRIRRLIGEPTATRLDVAVVAFARRANVKEVVEQVCERIGGRGITMELPVTVAFGGGADELDDLPDLELGALGG
ncbi:MAG: YkvA family protein [Planctomycetota bacterium]